MSNKTFLPLALLICGATTILAADIRGIIYDNENQPLAGTAISLTNLNDSTRRLFTSADENGSYLFKNVEPGKYSLEASMVSMTPTVLNLEVTDKDSILNIDTIYLSENGTMLQEAVITAVKAAVVAKQDTLEFNAGSFHTQANASVGDLLKKLPGVEVGSDGSITSNGKSVTKILVDGKEFFSDDPSMASKNLPSDMVDKVQVIDRKSDLAKLTGVDDGEEETVINLTVKKNMKNGWFGTIGAGYGTDGRYEGNFNINSFTGDNQISIIGGTNNINQMGFSDRGRGRFRSFSPSGGINTSSQLGVNFNVGKGEKFRVGGNVFYTHTSTESERYSEVQHLYPDSISMERKGSRSTDKGDAINANFRMQWNIDDNNTIDFRPTFYFNSRKSLLNDSSSLFKGDFNSPKVNSVTNQTANKGYSYSIGGELIYNHKFASRPGRSFSTQLKYSFSDTHEHTTTLSDIEYLLAAGDAERLYRYLDNSQWSNSASVRLTWTEPIGDISRGNFITAAYQGRINSSNADALTYNLPSDDISFPFTIPYLTSAPDGTEPADSLSNRFRNFFISHELRLGYKKITSTYNLEAGIVASPSTSRSTDLIDDRRNLPSRTVWNIAPFANIRFKFSKQSSLRLRYQARTSEATSKQLQPVADISDPMNIVVGNPLLKPTFTQSISGFYNNYNYERQQAFNAMIRASLSLNSIVGKTVTDNATGARTTTYENANGNYNIMAMMMINQPFRNRSFRYTANLSIRYQSTPGYINGDFNRSGDLSIAPRAGITYSTDIFQISLNPQYSFNMAANTLSRQPNQYIHNYGFNADASLFLPFGLELTTDIDFNRSEGYANGFDNQELLWNAKLSYSFLRDKSLTLSVRAYDILGQKKNISRSVSSSTITDSRYNDLTRYVMFGISYTFNTLKNRTKQQPDMLPGVPPAPDGERRPHPGMGGPQGRERMGGRGGHGGHGRF